MIAGLGNTLLDKRDLVALRVLPIRVYILWKLSSSRFLASSYARFASSSFSHLVVSALWIASSVSLHTLGSLRSSRLHGTSAPSAPQP
jgi:hypothetical protein